MQLHSTRLVLRPYQPDDYTAIREINADDVVQQMQGADPVSEEQSQAWFRSILASADEQPRTRYQFAIVRQLGAPLIGFCKLVITHRDWREAEIGYLLNQASWGKGYATEAAAALLRFGFDELGLHRITAGCWVANVGSARVMEKIGMRREAHLRESAWILGSWQDVLHYAILDHEWRSRPTS